MRELLQDIVQALQAGQADTAEKLSRQALRQQPGHLDASVFLALALHQQRKLDEALLVYGELQSRQPDEAAHWGNAATAWREAGHPGKALVAYRKALELRPDDPEPWFNLGSLQLEQADYVEARASLFEALRLTPDAPEARIRAARACVMCRDSRAEELLLPWREWLPLDEALQLELADLQSTLGEATTAQLLLEDLLERNPRQLAALLLLSAVYERVNRLDDAEATLRRVVALASDPPAAVRQEIAHRDAVLAFRRGEWERARALLLATGPRNAADAAHYFVLAGMHDKLRDYPAALAALDRAHAMQAEELRLTTPQSMAPDAPALPVAGAWLGRDSLGRWPMLRAPEAAASPVFIVGYPRSGTTLLEQMLDAHPQLQSMDERPFFRILADRMDGHGYDVPADLERLTQADCDELRKQYLELVCSKIERRWDTQLVDKNPLNMLWLPLIHRLFPQARFILALRHPCDVLLSNYMQNFRASALVAACTSVDRLARAYVSAMQSWLHHVELLQPQILVSRYEELVADPPAQTRRIGEFLGLADAAPLLSFDQHARDKGYIATPSYTQVIQPVNRKGLGRWQHYRELLEPVLPILQPMLDRWDYTVDAGSP